MEFTTTVKVSRIGSHTAKSASGTTEIVWNFAFLATSKGIHKIKVDAPPQKLTLQLEAWNDDTDKDDKWTEELTISKVKIDGKKSRIYW
jgi:predicted nucleotidyltransferase